MYDHIDAIEKIREIENKTELITQSPVFDISHWNCGKNYQDYIYQYLEIPIVDSLFDYIYSYEITQKIHENVRRKLNIVDKNFKSIFFSSSTLAIVNIANFFQKKECKRVCILQPSYFSVVPCMKSFGIEIKNQELEYDGNRFSIPIKKLLKYNFDAVWVTSPVACTNLYFDNKEIEKLNNLLEKQVFVICDESLAPLGMELSPKLLKCQHLISIHSPHKVIGTNATKFSCIIAHEHQQEFFEKWTDLFAGGLTVSSKAAIMHFLSPNYNFVLEKGMQYVTETYRQVIELLDKHNNFFTYTSSPGIYMTIFFKYLPFKVSLELSFIKNLILKTNISLLPGYLEGYFEELGFCFRINLTLDRSSLLLALNKVILYLEDTYL